MGSQVASGDWSSNPESLQQKQIQIPKISPDASFLEGPFSLILRDKLKPSLSACWFQASSKNIPQILGSQMMK